MELQTQTHFPNLSPNYNHAKSFKSIINIIGNTKIKFNMHTQYKLYDLCFDVIKTPFSITFNSYKPIFIFTVIFGYGWLLLYSYHVELKYRLPICPEKEEFPLEEIVDCEE